jgi:hypothetical protein
MQRYNFPIFLLQFYSLNGRDTRTQDTILRDAMSVSADGR